MRNEQISQAVTKPGGFYIEHVPGERPSKFYIESSTTQETSTKKPGNFYIEHVPGERPSKFYIERLPAHVVFSLRAKKKEEEQAV
jgi:hypothetical protein